MKRSCYLQRIINLLLLQDVLCRDKAFNGEKVLLGNELHADIIEALNFQNLPLIFSLTHMMRADHFSALLLL